MTNLLSDKIKLELDSYTNQYEVEGFIKDDPIQFPYKFKEANCLQDAEIAGFLASCVAYGKREKFVEKLDIMFNLMDNKPHDFLSSFDKKDKLFKDFSYRFSKGSDFIQLFEILHKLYDEKESLKSLFEYSYKSSNSVKGMLQGVCNYFYSNVTMDVSQGFYHFIPNPNKNSALKRLNMLLRWFVRDGKVDLGIWNFIDKSELLIPLDTHVARISRELGLLTRNNDDFQSVIELTENLKKLDPKDPVKYDFALFGYGINHPIK